MSVLGTMGEEPISDLQNEQCRLATFASWPVSLSYPIIEVVHFSIHSM